MLEILYIYLLEKIAIFILHVYRRYILKQMPWAYKIELLDICFNVLYRIHPEHV